MRESGFSRLLFRRILPLLIMIMAVFFLYNIAANFFRIRRLRTEVERMERRIEQAEAEQEELKLELERLDDPDYIEILARRRLGMVNPGEELIIPYEPEEESDEEAD